MMHRQLHAHGLSRASTAASPVQAQAPVAALPAAAASWFSGLLPAHDDSRTCSLFDQLAQAETCVMAELPALAPAPSAFALALALGQALARHAALFDARGPPCRL